MNKTIEVLGTIKQNKNMKQYIDTADGRVRFGLTLGFKQGQELMGTAICSPRKTDYPAVGTAGQPGYQDAHTADEWQCENFISEEMQTRQIEAKARKATANFGIAKTNKATAALAAIEINSTADVFALVG